MLRITIRPRAAAAIDDAVKYYEQQASPVVAQRFVAELQVASSLIAQNPDIGSKRFAHLFPAKKLRHWSMQHFPFRIFYLVLPGEVQVVAVEHFRRQLTGPLTV